MLRKLLDRQAKLFEKGGRLQKLYPVWEAQDTFLYTPGKATLGPSHVRDAVDLKRIMVTVVLALVPCVLMAMWNTGRQAHLAIQGGAQPLDTWQTGVMQRLGLAFDAASVWANAVHGALYYLPVLVVTFAVGGTVEAIFSVVRKHEINEGFLVTGMLFPLTLPATIPLWQVALGIAFGVLFGKEVFGGTGMNVLNPALTARAFLFFAYPAQISGDAVWVAARTSPDGYSGATLLGQAASGGYHVLRTADSYSGATAASEATRQSWEVPIDNSGSPCARASSARRRNQGREASGSSASGGIVISPRIPGNDSIQPGISSGATPDFDASPERFTSSSAGTVSLRAADSESSEWTSSQIGLTTFTLFDWRWPMKCQRNASP